MAFKTHLKEGKVLNTDPILNKEAAKREVLLKTNREQVDIIALRRSTSEPFDISEGFYDKFLQKLNINNLFI